MHRYKWWHLYTTSQSYTPPILKTVQKWLAVAQIWVESYGTFMHKEPFCLYNGNIYEGSYTHLGKDQPI